MRRLAEESRGADKVMHQFVRQRYASAEQRISTSGFSVPIPCCSQREPRSVLLPDCGNVEIVVYSDFYTSIKHEQRLGPLLT